MRFLSDLKINLKGKRVLLRADFNVPIKGNKVVDDFRIKKTLPTINFLRKKGAKVIIISHLTDGKNKSLAPVAKYLSKYIGTDIVLLENIRNYPGEEKNDKNFAKKLAKLGDIYVNDAFSASHRRHASIVGIPQYLPSYAGLLFEEEFKNLSRAFKPAHPFLLILGGVKFGSKLGVLEKFSKKADKIFIGGALANSFFWEKKVDIGKSVLDKKANIKKFLRNPNIVLPIDVKKKKGAILDIGKLATKELELLVKNSKFIVWNGPMGNFEMKGFEKGTMAAAKAIAESRAKSILGGGDTIAAINKAKIPLKKFSFVSTAGGAMLEFLAKDTLPGIKVLS